MGKIFEGQTALEVTVNIGADITGATVVLNYRSPSGVVDTFNATTITIVSRKNGVIKYIPFDETDLNESGVWDFWVTVTFADGREANGEVFCEEIFKVGSKNN